MYEAIVNPTANRRDPVLLDVMLRQCVVALVCCGTLLPVSVQAQYGSIGLRQSRPAPEFGPGGSLAPEPVQAVVEWNAGLGLTGRERLPGDWGFGFGRRPTSLIDHASPVLSLQAERQWGHFRGAYTLYAGSPETSLFSAAHRFQLIYQFSDRSNFGLAYSSGREVDNAVPFRNAYPIGVENWSIGGRHWLSPSWALTYDAVREEQGSLYRRQGLRLGVRHSF